MATISARLAPAAHAGARRVSRPTRQQTPAVRRTAAPAARETANQQSAAAAVAVGLLLALTPAAVQASDLSASLRQEIDAIEDTLDFLDQGAAVVAGAATSVVPYVTSSVSAVVPSLQSAYDAISPYVSTAATAAWTAAGPAAQSAQDALKGAGVDVPSVVSTAAAVGGAALGVAGTAVDVGKDAVGVVASTDLSTLGTIAATLVAVALLAPPVLGAIGGVARGYAGGLRPAQALDKLLSDGNAILLDIRREGERTARGVPELPAGAAGRVLSFERDALAATRGLLRNPGAVEAQLTALKVGSLRSVNKGTLIILLDAAGREASFVAKELQSLGFGRVYTIDGGYDGWARSGLKSRSVASRAQAEFVFSAPKLALPAPKMALPPGTKKIVR